MKRLILTASLLAAVVATPAFAQQGPKLDDPGYLVKGPRSLTQGPRELTKTPPPGQDDELPPPGEEDEGNGPGGPSAKDRLLPPSNDKYTDTPPCLSADQALSRLTGQGWQEFHAEVVLDESVSKLRARRTDGQLYELTVNRCSALVLDARPIVANYRTYAYTPPPNTYYGGERYYGRWNGHGDWRGHSHWHRDRHCVRHGNHRHCHWHWHRNRHVHHNHAHRHHFHRHHHHGHHVHHHGGHRFAHHHHHHHRRR